MQFRRLFPDIEPNIPSRCRIPIAADICGQTLAAIPDNLVYPTMEEILNMTFQTPGNLFTSTYDYRAHLTTDFQNFSSWRDLYPPNVQNGDSFTTNYQILLNNSFYDVFTDQIVPYGYADNPTIFPQPFTVENIVIITDGFCASGMFQCLLTITVAIY